jgi:hypothetical protein
VEFRFRLREREIGRGRERDTPGVKTVEKGDIYRYNWR